VVRSIVGGWRRMAGRWSRSGKAIFSAGILCWGVCNGWVNSAASVGRPSLRQMPMDATQLDKTCARNCGTELPAARTQSVDSIACAREVRRLRRVGFHTVGVRCL
jgi:hypothetical protein